MAGAVGIELQVTLKTRKLLILLNEKNDKNAGFTQARYTPGTRFADALTQETRCLDLFTALRPPA